MARAQMLLNKRLCKQFILEYAARSRAHRFTRVSDNVYPVLEEKLRNCMRSLVDGQPSIGKTVK